MNALHRLIHSLDKGEKRYFKIFTSRHIINGSRHDNVLFDLIAKMKVYDEELLKTQIEDPSLLRNLNIYKHLLYKQLLKALSTYHLEKDEEDVAYEQYKISKLLFDKGLFDEALKAIANAKEIAKSQEQYGLIFHISETESIYYSQLFKTDEYKANLIDKIEENSEAIKCISELNSQRELLNKLIYLTKSKGVHDTTFNEVIYTEFSENLARLEIEPDSEKARLLNLELKARLDYVKGNHEASIKKELQIKEKLRNVYKTDRVYYHELMSCLVRMAASYLLRSDLKGVSRVLAEAKQVPDINNNIILNKSKLFLNFEIIYLLNTGNIRLWRETIEKVDDLMEQHSDTFAIEHVVVTYQNLAIYLFTAGRYAEALDCIKKILSHSARKIATDIIIAARLMQLAILFEQNNMSVLRVNTDASKRYILKYRKLSLFEKLFFEFMTKTAKSHDMKSIRQRFQKMQDALKDEPIPNYNSIFPYVLWIKSHIEGTPISELLAVNVDEETLALVS